MKGSIVAVATGAFVVLACGGIALAAEPGLDPVADAATGVVSETAAPVDDVADEEPEDDGETVDGSGVTCVLAEGVAIDQISEPDAITCSGTGNERSAEVALVPRHLAHSGDLSGAEKGAAISAWAKTHANQTTGEDDGGDSAVEGGAAASGDGAATEEPSAPATSPGRSGDAPGHGSSSPGNGRGR